MDRRRYRRNTTLTMRGPGRSAATRRLAAVVASVGAVGWFAVAGAAPAQSADELPPITINSTTLHDGDTITITGTGCVDPDTSSGEGLVVHLIRPTDFGRGGIANLAPMLTVDVEADGTFAGSTVVQQPLYPVGAQTGLIDCRRRGDDNPASPPLRSRPIDLVIVPPSLPDLTVQAGSPFDYTLPCSISGGEYGRFGFDLNSTGPDVLGFGMPGSYPYETSPKAGDRISLTVPTATPPGTYDATASCSVSEAGVSAYFTGFTVTITPSTSVDGGANPASAATPLDGSPSYTG